MSVTGTPVKHLTSAEVMISWLESRIGLSAVSPEPASDPLFPSLSAPPPACSLSLSLKKKYLKINKHKEGKKARKKVQELKVTKILKPKKCMIIRHLVAQLVEHLALGFDSGHDLLAS